VIWKFFGGMMFRIFTGFSKQIEELSLSHLRAGEPFLAAVRVKAAWTMSAAIRGAAAGATAGATGGAVGLAKGENKACSREEAQAGAAHFPYSPSMAVVLTDRRLLFYLW
jgi:hypothetical protein